MPKGLAEFSLKEVEKITNASPRQVCWWEERGLFKSTGVSDRTKWSRRLYTLDDIVCILVIKALRQKGISIQKIRQSVDKMKITGVDLPLAQLRVAYMAHTVAFKKNGNFFEPLSGQILMEEVLEIIRPHVGPRRYSRAKRSVKEATIQYQQKLAEF